MASEQTQEIAKLTRCNAELERQLAERDRDLAVARGAWAESREQQTATAEILRVIASAPTDLQSVLDTVAASAARLFGPTDVVVIHRVEGDVQRIVTVHGAALRELLGVVIPITRGHTAGR